MSATKQATKQPSKQATKPAPGAPLQRKGAVSVPSISLKDMEEGQSFYFQPIAEIVDKPDLDKNGKQKVDADTDQPQFLHILRVIDLTSGEMGEIVLGYIVNKDLRSLEGGYVGRKFEMVKGAKKNRTVMWSLFEVE